MPAKEGSKLMGHNGPPSAAEHSAECSIYRAAPAGPLVWAAGFAWGGVAWRGVAPRDESIGFGAAHVHSVGWAHSSELLVSASDDGSARVWEVPRRAQ